MCKGFLIALLCAVVHIHARAQDKGIKFVKGTHWNDIVTKARITGKFIFVDCYASWCGPCKAMDNDVYTASHVGAFFNATFISVKMQMDKTTRDPENLKLNYEDAAMLKDRYGVTAFPTFLFFSPDGKILHRGLGYLDTASFLLLGKLAIDPDEQFYTLSEKYKKRELSMVGMKKFALVAASLESDSLAHSAANTYIETLRSKELWTVDNLHFIYQFTTSTNDPGFALFRDSIKRISLVDSTWTAAVCEGIDEQIIYKEHIKPLVQSFGGKPDWKKIKLDLRQYGRLGEKALNAYLPKLVFQSVIEPEMAKKSQWESVLTAIKTQNLGEREKYLVTQAIGFYERRIISGDSTMLKSFMTACQYLKVHYPELAGDAQLNEFAWTVFQHDNHRKDLDIALRWSKHVIDSVGPGNIKDLAKANYVDTYANLLYKLGQTHEALTWEAKAIDMNPNPKYQDFANNLKNMKAGKQTW